MSSSNSPCAACKFLRRKCTQECVFAPYFPPDQPQKFANVHKVFGASNVAKLLNELNATQREDAVNSLAYEAEFRLRDPVYGCVGLISVLQHKLKQMQTDLYNAKKELASYIGPQAMLPILQPQTTPSPYNHHLSPMMGIAPSPSPSPSVPGSSQQMIIRDSAVTTPAHHHHHHLQQQQQQLFEAQQLAAAVAAREQEMFKAYEHKQSQQQQRQQELLSFNNNNVNNQMGASNLTLGTFVDNSYQQIQQHDHQNSSSHPLQVQLFLQPQQTQQQLEQQHHHHHQSHKPESTTHADDGRINNNNINIGPSC
ncbi:LOB domain-containing protein 36 [Cucumis sativus]|uniref:LOB domain-containing protein n=1 Tax=Cucumis sativus TaxID=3659 RepID=A0A0A0LM25_CUCSA|nr:LOB domain-containing protein 36 [Cucumis sativus]XP_031736456.1 LOB domain-containing protein 36 [Cucumis sativus]KGN62069.1 hypothetical protein Csa_006727 [Cucumis sativus]